MDVPPPEDVKVKVTNIIFRLIIRLVAIFLKIASQTRTKLNAIQRPSKFVTY